MLRPLIWLRAASIIALLYALAHTAGMPWTPHGVGQPAIEAMQSVTFDISGSPRTYWSFYEGFGLALAVLMFFQAVLLWQIAPLAETGVAGIRMIVWMQLACVAVTSLVVAYYIFIVPALFGLAIMVCLGVSLLPRREILSPAP
jgi:hypothetical protein